jgi:O-antigen/teichoic acid export membrane protein
MERSGESQGPPSSPARRTRTRVSYNAVIRLAGRVTGSLITLAALRLITRHYGPTLWGEVVAASSLANFFVAISDFGVMRVVSRDLAVEPKDAGRTYGAGLMAGGLVVVAAMVAMTVVAALVYGARPELRSLSLVLVLSLPPNMLWLVSAGVLVARTRNDTRAVVDVLSSFFLLAATGATVAGLLGVAGYIWLTVAADLATGALCGCLARRYLRADFRGGKSRVGYVIRQAWPLGMSQGLNGAAQQAVIVMLALLASLATVGRFGIAMQIAAFGTSVPLMLTAALLPKFVAGKTAQRERLLQRAFDVLAAAGSFLPVAAVLAGQQILFLIGGRRFTGSPWPLIMLSCFVALSFPSAVFTDSLVYLKEQKAVLRASLVGTAVTVAVAAAAIPPLGASGAAVGLIAGAAALLTSAAWAFKRRARLELSCWSAGRYLGLSAGLIGIYLLVHLGLGFNSPRGWLVLPELGLLTVAYAGLAIAINPRLRRGN